MFRSARNSRMMSSSGVVSEIANSSLDNLLMNGCSIHLKCSLNNNTLYEVKYYFDVLKPEDSGLTEEALSKILNQDINKNLDLSNSSNLIRKIVKKSEIENSNNSTIETGLRTDIDFK